MPNVFTVKRSISILFDQVQCVVCFNFLVRLNLHVFCAKFDNQNDISVDVVSLIADVIDAIVCTLLINIAVHSDKV